MCVAVAAVAAFGDHDALIGLREVVQDFSGFVVVDDGAHWNFDFQVGAAVTATVAAFTVAAAFGAEHVIESEFQKGVFVDIGDEVDVSAVAAIAAAWTAARDEFFTAEGYAAVSAVACFNCDFGFVYERGLFHWLDRNESSGCAFVFKLHNAGDLREERVVLADADVQAWFEPRAALANEDRAAGDELAGKALHSKPLRVAVATVARAALTFFMSHGIIPYATISVIRTRVKTLRCPRVLRKPLRRFFLKTRIFGPRDSPSTTA